MRDGVGSLSSEQLLEACLDRGFGSAMQDEAQMRKRLGEWLEVTAHDGESSDEPHGNPYRVRLAAMAAFAMSSVRRPAESSNRLPRLLYAP